MTKISNQHADHQLKLTHICPILRSVHYQRTNENALNTSSYLLHSKVLQSMNLYISTS